MQIVSTKSYDVIPTIESALFEDLQLSSSDRMDVSLNATGKWFRCEMYGIDPRGNEGYATWTANDLWPQRVPERKRFTAPHPRSGFEFAATDFSALLIHSLWNKSAVTFTDEARIVYDFLLHRLSYQNVKSWERSRYQVADAHMRAWFIKTLLPRYKFLDNKELPLAPYQKVGLNGCMNQEASALFMEQGTGKTPIVISRICNESLACKKGLYRALIVCPKNVMTNWRNEFIRFATVKGRIALLRGGQLERVKRLVDAFIDPVKTERWSVVICSYETVNRSWEAMQLVNWDLCVLDESHYIKSTYAKRFKHMMKLRDKCRQRMCLTGTPIANTLMDIYAQLEFLGEGLSGFTSIKRFRTFYGKWIKTKDGLNVLTGYENVPVIQERIARLAFVIRKKDALPDLPEKVHDILDVEMSVEQRTYYDLACKQLMIEIKNDLNQNGDKVLIIKNILTKLLRLSQITAGYIKWEDPDGLTDGGVDRIDPNPKLEALIELIKDETKFDKVIVWCCWVEAIKFIRARLELEGINSVTYYGGTKEDAREKAVDDFNNDPECKVFIGNPAAGGVGINLLGYGEGSPKTDCSHVVYYAMNWSPVQRSQSEDRSHRMGTRHNVRYTDLCVPNSIDEEIRVRVLNKQRMAFQIQDVNSILETLLRNKK